MTTPNLSRKFAGFDIEVVPVFTANQALTADQATWANSQYATVLGNAFGGSLRRAKEAGKPLDVEGFNPQAHFDAIVADFTFGARAKSAAAPRDPVEALMLFLAKEAVKARIIKKGLKVKTFMDTKITVGEGDNAETISKFAELVEAYLDRNHDALRASAEAQLAITSAEDNDTDLDIDELSGAEEVPAAAE